MPMPRNGWSARAVRPPRRNSRAHELQVETLRLTQLAEQARARTAQIEADVAEVQSRAGRPARARRGCRGAL